jgi:hypothetical protein
MGGWTANGGLASLTSSPFEMLSIWFKCFSHHDKFHRGRPDLCMTMVRTRVNGKGCRRPGDPDNEPDFYEREYAPSIAPGSEVEIPTEASSVGGLDDESSDMQIDSVEATTVAV